MRAEQHAHSNRNGYGEGDRGEVSKDILHPNKSRVHVESNQTVLLSGNVRRYSIALVFRGSGGGSGKGEVVSSMSWRYSKPGQGAVDSGQMRRWNASLNS